MLLSNYGNLNLYKGLACSKELHSQRDINSHIKRTGVFITSLRSSCSFNTFMVFCLKGPHWELLRYILGVEIKTYHKRKGLVLELVPLRVKKQFQPQKKNV